MTVESALVSTNDFLNAGDYCDNSGLYNERASEYAAHSDRSPHNSLYERPATEAMLGDISGLDILDIGCGSGALITDLLKNKPRRLVGVDSSPGLVAIARRRVGNQATIYEHDIRLPFREEQLGLFDIVVASLVLHYFAAWNPILSNIASILRANGRLVFSIAHPLADAHLATCYSNVEEIAEWWPTLGVHVKSFRRPLASIVDSLASAGFTITRLVEPHPSLELATTDPRLYATLKSRPLFIIVEATKQNQNEQRFAITEQVFERQRS